MAMAFPNIAITLPGIAVDHTEIGSRIARTTRPQSPVIVKSVPGAIGAAPVTVGRGRPGGSVVAAYFQIIALYAVHFSIIIAPGIVRGRIPFFIVG